MDMFQIITELTTTPGVSGNEDQVAEVIKKWFRNWTDDVWSDVMNNTYARFGNPDGPTILLMAHMDEIGLMVADIEDNGMIRLYNVAGVDPRVLPGDLKVPSVMDKLLALIRGRRSSTDQLVFQSLCLDHERLKSIAAIASQHRSLIQHNGREIRHLNITVSHSLVVGHKNLCVSVRLNLFHRSHIAGRIHAQQLNSISGKLLPHTQR